MKATEVLALLNALAILMQHTSGAIERISALLQQAQDEGRDLSESEIAQAREVADSAMADWNAGNAPRTRTDA